MSTARTLRWLGALCLAAALFYFFGQMFLMVPGNRQVSWWMVWIGGASLLALGGSVWLHRAERRLVPLFISLGGAGLVALAQVPPLLIWPGMGQPVVRTGALLLHGTLLALAVSTAYQSLRELRPLAKRKHYGGFLVACLLVAASPYLYYEARSALWLVKAEPPDGATVPLHARFRYTWASPRYFGNGASIDYTDGTRPPHTATEGGQGWIQLFPEHLLPGKELQITIRSTAGSRTYRYRTAETAAPVVDLYRAVLAQWFRAPQAGEMPSAVILERIPGLSHEQQEAVEDGIAARTVRREPVPSGRPLVLTFAREDVDRVRLQARRGDWNATVIYRGMLENGGWRITPEDPEPVLRPWGPS